MNFTRKPLGDTGLKIFPLCLGGNVFGWTADEQASFEILDAYVAAGGNYLDTADGYSRWVPGHTGGESETIIGKWLASRGNREDMVISTKVFGHPDFQGLSGRNIRAACEASLKRLQTDYVDVYFAHHDDPNVQMEETLEAFTGLIEQGKVRAIGASNFSPERLDQALLTSQREGFASYRLCQDRYNLVDRGYEDSLRPVVDRYGLVQVPYYALASGFLTGKYRSKEGEVDSGRGGAAGRWLSGHCSDYLDGVGGRVLNVLDRLAAEHNTEVATIALGWLLRQPTVAAPIASARTAAQLPALVAVAGLDLSADDVEALDVASTVGAAPSPDNGTAPESDVVSA